MPDVHGDSFEDPLIESSSTRRAGRSGRVTAEADMQRFVAVTPPSVNKLIVELERRGFDPPCPASASQHRGHGPGGPVAGAPTDQNLWCAGKTGAVSRMKESNNEGVASHVGPESWACVRKGKGQALTGERVGRVLSREN